MITYDAIPDLHIARSRSVGWVSTFPRSGTLRFQYLFSYVGQLLEQLDRGQETVSVTKKHITRLPEPWANNRIEVFWISHGFSPAYRGWTKAQQEIWHDIDMPLGDVLSAPYLPMLETFRKQSLGDDVNFMKNENFRIIGCYRNLIDQGYSMYLHTKSHVTEELRRLTDRPFNEFLLEAVLPYYVRYVLSFHYSRECFPDRVQIVRYEDFQQDPVTWMQRMLTHLLGAEAAQRVPASVIELAVELTSKDQMRQVEVEKGHSLAGDHFGEGASHIRSVSRKDWQDLISSKDEQKMQDFMARYGLALEQFC